MIWYERSLNGRGLHLPDLDTCPFATIFSEAMQQYKSSRQVFNPRRLVTEFVSRYMPHERLGDVMGANREATEFFECLAGYQVTENQQRRNVEREVYPCLSMSDFQPPVEWRLNVPPCNCRPNTRNREKILPFIGILVDGEGQNLSLQQLVENALNVEKPLRPNFYCQTCGRSLRGYEKTTLIRGIPALPVNIQAQHISSLRLGGDLAINTRDDGVVHYSLIGGVQYTPGHFGKSQKLLIQELQ